MDYLLISFLVFILGTLILIRTKQQRFLGVLFMIRTERFIPFIDKIARLSPGLWNFLADLSIVFSFGGLGAAYLADYRKTTKNLQYILGICSVLAVILWAGETIDMFPSQGILPGVITLAAILAVFLFVSFKSLPYLENKYADFLCSTIIFSLVFIKLSDLILTVLGSVMSIPLYISIIEGAFGIPPLLFGMFMMQAYSILFQGSQMPGVSPMVPSVQGGQVGISVPGYDIFVPIIYALIAFFVLLVCHEFAHGVLARVSKIKLKSVGLATFGIIPIGAFVEPDEKELDNKPSLEKMRVFSAGSFANLIVCVISIILMLSMSLLLVSPDGVKLISVSENGTANGTLQNDMIIRSIDGVEVKSIQSYKDTLNVTPGKAISFGTDKGTFNIIPREEPVGSGKGYIGILVVNNVKPNYGLDMGILEFIWTTLSYMIFFNFNVALVNILPVAPFDGWRMLREILSVFGINEETTKKIVFTIVGFGVLLLFINALPLLNIVSNYLTSIGL